MRTTLNKIREYNPSKKRWTKLLKHLGKTEPDDEPLSLLTILDSNGFEDALWCTRAVKGYDKELRLFAVWCAGQVQHLMSDPRSVAALDVAERYAKGLATADELKVAHERAGEAASTARVAYIAADAIALAAARAADAAARVAYAAADADASYAASTVYAVYVVAARAAYHSAKEPYDKAKQAQKAKFRKMLEEIEGVTDEILLEKVFNLLQNLNPHIKVLNEYAETFYNLKRELGIPKDKSRVLLIGGLFHQRFVDESMVNYKWPPFRYIRHPWKPPESAAISSETIIYNRPDEVYELTKFTCGELAYVYRKTIAYDPGQILGD